MNDEHDIDDLVWDEPTNIPNEQTETEARVSKDSPLVPELSPEEPQEEAPLDLSQETPTEIENPEVPAALQQEIGSILGEKKEPTPGNKKEIIPNLDQIETRPKITTTRPQQPEPETQQVETSLPIKKTPLTNSTPEETSIPIPQKEIATPEAGQAREDSQSEIPQAPHASGAVRSYFSDMDRVMKEGQTGTMAKVLERAREEKTKKERFSPTSRKNIIFIALGLTLLIAGIGVLAYIVGNIGITKTVDVREEMVVPSLVRAEHHAGIDLANTSPGKATALTKEALREINGDSQINHLYFTDINVGQLVRLGSVSLFQKFGITIPARLAQSLNNNFMYGVYAYDGKKEPFLVFTTNSFDRTFAGMREWEPNLLDDLKGIFNIPTQRLNPDTFENTFTSRVLENQNVRVLVENSAPTPDKESPEEDTKEEGDESQPINNQDLFTPVNQNDILLMYTFLNENVLIITTQSDVITELNKRIGTQQIFNS
jgi:hypothetical protein